MTNFPQPAVMYAIRPRYCRSISLGLKSIEVRRRIPRLKLPYKSYIYCTKTKKPVSLCVYDPNGNPSYIITHGGVVVGEFVCDGIEEYVAMQTPNFYKLYMMTNAEKNGLCHIDYNKLQLDDETLYAYGKGDDLYGLHISNLKMYQSPLDLSKFSKPCPKSHNCFDCNLWWPGVLDYDRCEPPCCGFWESPEAELKSQPQSWYFVEELQC